MSILTERERLRAKVLVDKGLSYGEVAHMLLQKRNVGMQRPMAEEIAALFGRKLYPILPKEMEIIPVQEVDEKGW